MPKVVSLHLLLHLTKPSQLTVSSVSKTNPSACSSNGKLTVNRSGGSSPYLYSLNNGSYVSSNVFSNLSSGTYTVSVKDANGCIASLGNITLTAPACQIARPANEKRPIVTRPFKIKVYPTPTMSQFSLIAESEDQSEVEIVVTDILGINKLRTRIAANNVFTFGKDWNDGTYIVQALQGKDRAILKVIKLK